MSQRFGLNPTTAAPAKTATTAKALRDTRKGYAALAGSGEHVRGDDADLASCLRIEEREVEAGGLT